LVRNAMTRKRMIDPKIWEDPGFNRLSIQARLLFIGMFSNADDDGYLRGDEGSLKRLIFGFDEVKKEDMGTWIIEVEAMGSVHFFEENNEKYVHLINWEKYQKQQKDRRIPSTYPLCSKCLALADASKLSKVKLSKVKLREDKKRRDVSSSKKMYYDGLEVRKAQNKLWVIPKDGGKWLEFAGNEKDIRIE